MRFAFHALIDRQSDNFVIETNRSFNDLSQGFLLALRDVKIYFFTVFFFF